MIKISLSIFAIFLFCFETYADLNQTLGNRIKYSDYDYHFMGQEDLYEDQFPPPSNLIDMETMVRDFILETKKIEFPGYPGAFNPSFIKWQGSFLMSFRVYNPANGSANPFALVWLNENFEPITVPQVFELPFYNPVLPSKQQDPRLISIGDRLFVVYNNILENIIHREIRRMFIVELFYDGKKFTAGDPECLTDFEGKNETRYEKNWVPFEYNGELLFGYSLIPHRILRPKLGTGTCETVASSFGNIKWDWGVPRGGTQAVLDGDHYLSFFHSWIDIPTVQSNGRRVSHYVMGAYTFQAHPPFAITAISPEPIVAKNFYSPPYYRTWKPLRCVFPAGIVVDDHYIWISYGRQDHEIWIAKLDKKSLLQSLISVPSK
jgi:predicted GH43/DUF377 family glycosyl hydrolase